MRGIAGACVVWMCLLVCGCREQAAPEELPPRQPARGVVTYNGQAPTGAVVILHRLPLAEADWQTPKPTGVVDAEGNFELWTKDPEDGAMAGDYAVTVRWESDGQNPAGEDVFEGRFAAPDQPAAQITITEGHNFLTPIELTGPAVKAPGGS